jgi:hypothetical protein
MKKLVLVFVLLARSAFGQQGQMLFGVQVSERSVRPRLGIGRESENFGANFGVLGGEGLLGGMGSY